jgi:hypothetical protein
MKKIGISTFAIEHHFLGGRQIARTHKGIGEPYRGNDWAWSVAARDVILFPQLKSK